VRVGACQKTQKDLFFSFSFSKRNANTPQLTVSIFASFPIFHNRPFVYGLMWQGNLKEQNSPPFSGELIGILRKIV